MAETPSAEGQADSTSKHQNAVPSARDSFRHRRRQTALLVFAIACLVFALYTTVYKPGGWLESLILPRGSRVKPEFDPHQVSLLKTVLTPGGQVNSTIPTTEIRSVNFRDGVSSLTDPPRVDASQADFLKPADRVIGVAFNAEAAAYPLRFLSRHQAVNDTIGGRAVLITYCPLCDAAAVFDRTIENRVMEFGISGFLYNSNVLLFDRDEEGGTSLWSQLKTESVTGRRAASPLVALPVELTTWSDWASRFPKTRVLSTPTDKIDYNIEPYSEYRQSGKALYPPPLSDDRLPTKEPVIGIWTSKASCAYALPAPGSGTRSAEFAQELDGHKFRLYYNPEARSLRITDAEPALKWIYSYWFAWYAFHPNTGVYRLSDSPEQPVIALPSRAAAEVR